MRIVGAGSAHETIQQGVDAASDGQTILVAPGTYNEDVNFNKSVTLLGAKAGDAGTDGSRDAANGADETTIVGHSHITATGPVTIDGVRFLNDATTSPAGLSNPTLDITTSGHTVTNSIFYSTVPGGNDGAPTGPARNDAAITVRPAASGTTSITNNYITGSETGQFDTASWGRGVFFDGGGGDLVFTGNTVENTRSGINLDVGGDSDIDVSGNTFVNDGSAISGALNVAGVVDGIQDNDFQNVGSEFNFRNLTTNLTFDAEEAIGTLTPANPANPANDFVVVLSGSGDDTISGTEGNDFIDANNGSAPNNVVADTDTVFGRGGNDTIFGRFGDDSLDGGANNDTIDGGDGDDELIGGSGVDALTGGGGDDTFDGGAGADTLSGGTGMDTATYGADATISRDPMTLKWQVMENGETDILTGVEKVVIGTTAYLLVDKAGAATGGFQSVQEAVDFASCGETILIAPGEYTESGIAGPERGGASNPFGLYINKPNLTLQGVNADGSAITSAADAQSGGATIISGAQTNFGANHFVDVGGTNVTLTGLHFQAGDQTDEKLLEIWADGAKVENNFIDVNKPDNSYSGAIAVFFNEDNTSGVEIESYSVSNNILNEGVGVFNGTGDTGDAADQVIAGNTFLDTFDPNTGEGRYDTITLQGEVVATGFNIDPIGNPTITGNTLQGNETPFILRNASDDPANFPSVAYVEQALEDNTTVQNTYAYVLTKNGDLRLAPRDYDGPGGSPPSNNYYVTNSIDTLNLALDAEPDAVFGGQRITQEETDTVVVQSGSEAVDSEIMVDNLTVRATENSADLNLTLADTLADGTTPVTVQTITLADYAPGMGADVDVTGNGLANTINGNSGQNQLSDEGGDDTLTGNGGDDALDGGEGFDTAVFSGEQADYDIAAAAGTITDNDTDTTDGDDDGDDGQDTFSGVEKLDFDDQDVFIVKEGDSIQAAVDAAQDGDTIHVLAGTYNESVNVNKDVTLIGAQGGVDGRNAARGDESTITGGVRIAAAGVTLDGFEITGSDFLSLSLDRPTGLLIGGDDATIVNTVL
ncbi:MAG: hypothetical protein H0T75_10425 [Rhizobiales bacterium]|nr:hypothetical protein [Hyphomicrobiales bacterium]